MSTPAARLLNWRTLRKNSLCGFATVQFTSGLIISEIGVHVTGSRTWVSPPARPWIKNSTVVLDEAGKPRWQPLIDFATKEARASWSRQVLDALREVHPEVFEEAEAPS